MVTADIRVHEFFKTSYFKMGIQPLPGAQRALHKLSRYCNLSIVTSVLLVKFLLGSLVPLVGLGKLWFTGPLAPQQGLDRGRQSATMVTPRWDCHVSCALPIFHLKKKKKVSICLSLKVGLFYFIFYLKLTYIQLFKVSLLEIKTICLHFHSI